MYHKKNRHYADWRNRNGKRKRRAFHTAAEASAYEQKQKRLVGNQPYETQTRRTRLSAALEELLAADRARESELAIKTLAIEYGRRAAFYRGHQEAGYYKACATAAHTAARTISANRNLIE